MCTCMHGTSTAVYICIWRPEDNLMESVFWVLGIKLSSQVWCKLLHPLSHLSGSLAGSCKALSDLSWSQTALEENSRGQRQPKSRGEKRAELGKSIGHTCVIQAAFLLPQHPPMESESKEQCVQIAPAQPVCLARKQCLSRLKLVLRRIPFLPCTSQQLLVSISLPPLQAPL